MGAQLSVAGANGSQVLEVVRRYWGFDALRPLQAEAIAAAVGGRDSLVVMPTGGGKSLCYQVPPLLDDGTDIVVSPLIALMKDQVDGLISCGYPAVGLHSGLEASERRSAEADVAAGNCRLLFVAPERLVTPSFLELVERLKVRRFAIDEAHCISQWGHDFRPEYRQLAVLRERFPQASLHAYTATATPRVRDDIVRQLHLRDPAMLIGRFDRPNLVYRIVPQVDLYRQAVEVVGRHPKEAVIVYCLTRRDTESMAATLRANGINALHYHAGMESDERRRTQDAFSAEQVDVVVATVAFGMGIDRSNVRCVLHAGLPKSIEHYQQETGRAGRDGLEAECVLLYSSADAIRWEQLLRKNGETGEQSQQIIAAQLALLKQMQRLCNVPQCRHKLLSEYFGQAYNVASCEACDHCLGEVEGVEDATLAAQKILSCVARTGERFGVNHVVDVLAGANTENVRRLEHDRLSTYGLMKEVDKHAVQNMVYQLIDQGLIDRTEGDRPVLKLNDQSWAVMRKERQVKLMRPKAPSQAHTPGGEASRDGADAGLFEALREWRKAEAGRRNLAPFVMLSDNVLWELARIRPTRDATLERVSGLGDKRRAELGKSLLGAIRSYSGAHQLATDVVPAASYVPPAKVIKTNPVKDAAFALFDQRRSVEEVQAKIARARSTTAEYLGEYIEARRPKSIDAWVDAATYQRVAKAAMSVNESRLKPIFELLGGEVAYDDIRMVVAHLRAQEPS